LREIRQRRNGPRRTIIDSARPSIHQAIHPFDVRQFRSALGRFASGVTIVTTRDAQRTHGMTANAFVSVSLNPPLILVSVDNRAAMNALLPMTRYYGVSVLAEDQTALSNHFAGREVEGVRIPFVDKHDVPVIDGAVAHFVARLVDMHPAGDHTLFIGHVEFFEFRDGRPLLFHAGTYQQLAVQISKPEIAPEDEMSLFRIGNIDPRVD
jgi:flavin reductase (DIM6/NTAB) family NADH-FMN oxidoreductase RutF